MDLQSIDVAGDPQRTRSRWELAIDIVVYAITQELVDDQLPVSFFRNDEEIAIATSLEAAETLAAAAVVCEASAQILPTTGSRPEVVQLASRMAGYFAVRAQAHSRRPNSCVRVARSARLHARTRRAGRRRARAPARRSSANPDDEPDHGVARESGRGSVPGGVQ